MNCTALSRFTALVAAWQGKTGHSPGTIWGVVEVGLDEDLHQGLFARRASWWLHTRLTHSK